MLKFDRSVHADDLQPEDILEGGSVVVRIEDSYDNKDMVAVYLNDEEDPVMLFNDESVDIYTVV